MYDVISSRKKKLKRLPSLKFCHSKSEIFRLLLHLWRHTPNERLIYLWSSINVSRFFVLVLVKCESFQKFILGKVCLKAVLKVALSLQRLASAQQVKISDHSAELKSSHRRRSYPVRWTNSCIEEEEEPEEMLLSRFTDETDLSDWYFIWFLRFDSFLLLSMRL